MGSEPRTPNTTLRFEQASASELVTVLITALESFADVAQGLTRAQWDSQSPCPGWTTGDVVAHVLALESELHEVPIPDHEPDWASLPHVTTPFGRYTEVPVDWYRGQGRDVVMAELREIILWRTEDLTDIPADLDEIVTGPAGWQTSRERMLRTRILDTWMHEQDIRTTAGLPGGLDTDAANIAAQQFISGLPFVWGKSTRAPIGASLNLAVGGPGIELDLTVKVDDDARARFVDSSLTEPTLRMRVGWPLYASLSGGRSGAIAQANSGGVEFHGDETLSQRLLPALATTP